MKTFRPAVLLVLVATACTTAPGAPPPPQPCDQGGFVAIVEEVTPSVVTVRHSEGIGSGVVYKPDVILTNQHVVGTHTDVTISYADGTESRATVLASDAASDLAVLRTERTGLTPARFATDQPRQGCEVLAIGSPLGFQNSVTEGIVSGLHRSVPAGSQGQAPPDLLQTDAPISPGNSGGALLDNQGRVVGISESYIPPQAGAVSLGFAIPAPSAVNVAEKLLAGGTAAQADLGVSVGELTPDIRDRLGVKTTDGALVLGVAPGSPAAAAGVRPGDVIVRLDSTDVHNVGDLDTALRAKKPGDQVTLVVVRGSDRPELHVTLGTQH
jgi:S1-C subfamily serine protease